MKKTNEHYYWLDLLRGLAALMVVATHYRGALFVEFGELPPTDKNIFTTIFYFITRIAHEAVLVFFILSGFLVGGKVIQRIRDNSFDLKSYYIDRAVRIFLPLLSAIIIILISNLLTDRSFSYLDYLGNIFSLQGILVPVVSDPLWSLTYEVWFYIFISGIAIWFQNNSSKYKFTSIFLILICFVIFSQSLKSTYLFIWLLGALSYFKVKKNNFLLFGSVILILISIVMYQFFGKQSRFFDYALDISYIIELLLGTFMCIFVQQVISRKPKNNLTSLLDFLGTKLANFSYTLYLTHMPIMFMLIHFGFPKFSSVNKTSIFFYLIAILISLVSSYIIYYFFEKRTKTVKDFVKKCLQ